MNVELIMKAAKQYEEQMIADRRKLHSCPGIGFDLDDTVAYVKGMEEYLQKLKSMKKSEAQKISFENLIKSEIITENGDFSERYEFTRMYIQKKV